MCVYVYIYIYIYTYAYITIDVYTCVCVYIYIYIYIYTCVHHSSLAFRALAAAAARKLWQAYLGENQCYMI